MGADHEENERSDDGDAEADGEDRPEQTCDERERGLAIRSSSQGTQANVNWTVEPDSIVASGAALPEGGDRAYPSGATGGSTMGFLSMIVVGLIAGLLARAIMPGKDPMGWIMTIVLGIVGSFVGGFLINFLVHNDRADSSALQPTGIIGRVIGALVVLGIYHLARRRAPA